MECFSKSGQQKKCKMLFYDVLGPNVGPDIIENNILCLLNDVDFFNVLKKSYIETDAIVHNFIETVVSIIMDTFIARFTNVDFNFINVRVSKRRKYILVEVFAYYIEI